MKTRILSMLLASFVCLLQAVAQKSDSVPAPASQPAKGKDFVVEAEMPYRANLRATGIFVNAFHLNKSTEEVVASIKAQASRSHVTTIICRGEQGRAIKDFWDVSDQFILEALFMKPDWNPPPEDALIWPGFDHPMVNYVRKIRTVTQGKPTIVSVPMTCREVWGVPRERTELFDELRWMAMATIGANYQGILWGHARREEQWNQMLQEFTKQIKTHAADLGSATIVDWVKAPEGQPVSALASQNKLFITLLNIDYMRINDDKSGISGATNPGRRQGTLTVKLPAGIIAETAITLDGSPVKLTQDKNGLTCLYDFASGGEMVVVMIKRTQ